MVFGRDGWRCAIISGGDSRASGVVHELVWRGSRYTYVRTCYSEEYHQQVLLRGRYR